VIVTLGGCASAFLVHTHNYPGRMSIHLVPLAIAAAVAAAIRIAAVRPSLNADIRMPVTA
jgi:hypothetical protein